MIVNETKKKRKKFIDLISNITTYKVEKHVFLSGYRGLFIIWVFIDIDSIGFDRKN